MTRSRLTYVALAVALALASMALAPSALAADATPSYVGAAVNDWLRPPADIQRDAARKPADTLTFSTIRPGDVVVDLNPGTGYYSRMLSVLVGPQGKVYMMVPMRAAAPGQARRIHALQLQKNPNAPPLGIEAALAIQDTARYDNTVAYWESLTYWNGAQLSVPEQRDAIWISDNYHDLHNDSFVAPDPEFVPEDPARAGPHIDIAAFDKAMFTSLKPGGVLVIIDHAGAKGTGTTQTATLHRIDEDAAKAEMAAAGFALDGEGDALRNPEDDHTKPIFDPSIRGKTDQFMLRFKKLNDATPETKRPTTDIMTGYYGNTVRTGGGTEDITRRWVQYLPNGYYHEWGVSGAAVQHGEWYWDAAGHNCMLHQYPPDERGGVVCHGDPGNKKVGDAWLQDNGYGFMRQYRLLPGIVRPNPSEVLPDKATSR